MSGKHATRAGTEKAPFLQSNSPAEHSPWLPRAAKAWFTLLLHDAICLAGALSIALAVNGYEAIETQSQRYVGGKLRLYVSDVTTLVSAGLVIVKLLVSSWSTLVLWSCRSYLRDRPSKKAIAFMMQWKLPPWFRSRFAELGNARNLIISVSLIVVLLQALISPILSGAINWNPSSVAGAGSVAVSSVNQNADFSIWYWYFAQGSFDKRVPLRRAAGYASLAWADSLTVGPDGSSLTGNGCRSIVNSNNLPRNSTLANAVIPCIDIHSITWYKPTDAVPSAESGTVADAKNISIIDDDPNFYYHAGVSYVFDPDLPWNGSQNTHVAPSPTLFSGTKTIGLLLQRLGDNQTCGNPTIFGDVRALGLRYIETWSNCFVIGKVNFTAGVTTSPQSTYLSPRVVEDQTPLNEVVFAPNAWVQESIWLLPDLMTMVAVMNSSQLPTWNNLDGYAKTLLRQSYLAAWNMYHDSFDETGPTFTATLNESRIRAEVSFVRVYVWLALCLLMTVSGALLLVLVLREEDLLMPEEAKEEFKDVGEQAKRELKNIGKEAMQGVDSSGTS